MSRIDDSHHSFKRGVRLGPGPKKQRTERAGDWECRKGKNTQAEYVQICKWIGPGKRSPIKVKRKKSKKRAYNKLYRAWAKRNVRVRAFSSRGARTGYRCRRTAVAKCR